ncbi:hypothetical protein TNCV_1359411 [Trichonephila clavipes]|nr:hypothetical protein TNCV_1359411 [Trichonephila clavipes]
MDLIEKIISESHRDEFSATSVRPSISPSPLRITSGHFPDVIPATNKPNSTRQCTVPSRKEIPEVSHKNSSLRLPWTQSNSRTPTSGCGLRQPSGLGIGSWQACHKFKPGTTKDTPCRRLIAWERYVFCLRRTISVDYGTSSELQPLHRRQSEIVHPLGH